MTAQKKHMTDCLVANGLNLFGDRWTLLVLRDLILHGKTRFSEFVEAEEGIATNILSDRLRRLEAEGIVTRSKDPSNGKSYVYRLTEDGIALAPVLFEIIRWSGRTMTMNAERRALLQRVQVEPEVLLEEIRARAAG